MLWQPRQTETLPPAPPHIFLILGVTDFVTNLSLFLLWAVGHLSDPHQDNLLQQCFHLVTFLPQQEPVKSGSDTCHTPRNPLCLAVETLQYTAFHTPFQYVFPSTPCFAPKPSHFSSDKTCALSNHASSFAVSSATKGYKILSKSVPTSKASEL